MEPCAEFTVHGVVDGRETVARWLGGHLDADPELLRRAAVVVALAEEFRCEGGIGTVPASIEAGGLASLLTLMRAFSHVTHVEVELVSPSASSSRLVLRCATS